MAEAYIVEALRTAGGRRDGRLKEWHPAALAGQALNGLLDRTGADPTLIEDVIMGCVGQAGEQSANIARSAVLSSRLPESVPATSVDRQCGSSQQALQFAAQAVMSGTMNCVIAAGVESMTRVPMGMASILAVKAGFGRPHGPAVEKRYPGVQFSQFTGAETMAKKYNLSREELDAFSFGSHQKAIKAVESGAFDKEILPIKISEDSDEMHTVDEGIRFDGTLEGMAKLKLIEEGGRLTAASSSQICDGSSAVLVVNEQGLKDLGVEPLARIHQLTVIGHDPVIMLEAPLPATKKALERASMSIDEIDLYEVNEAFASVPLAWLQELNADPAKLNINGGAIALGHPLGASGTKLMSTLVYGLHAQNKKWGLQTMCEGGGLANVTIIERC
ncbi:MAG: acetyl-CoA C-acetyltransferase [Pseudomonadales bacterium]|nr:acetyl-CoA C-acetyltransferase [Pseudomonadales bacterium]